MRTFPKSLATFRKIVEGRGEQLRRLSFEELRQLVNPTEDGRVEHLTVESRRATIGIIVQPRTDRALRVVVQGFMDSRLIPFIKNVALEGFYKYPGGTVAPMPGDEFYEFD